MSSSILPKIDGLFGSGEKVKIGTYTCVNCNETIYIRKDNDKLPECETCKDKVYWLKI